DLDSRKAYSKKLWLRLKVSPSQKAGFQTERADGHPEFGSPFRIKCWPASSNFTRRLLSQGNQSNSRVSHPPSWCAQRGGTRSQFQSHSGSCQSAPGAVMAET